MWDGVLCRVGETGKVDGYERTGGKGEFGKEGARKGELGKSVGWGKGRGAREWRREHDQIKKNEGEKNGE